MHGFVSKPKYDKCHLSVKDGNVVLYLKHVTASLPLFIVKHVISTPCSTISTTYRQIHCDSNNRTVYRFWTYPTQGRLQVNSVTRAHPAPSPGFSSRGGQKPERGTKNQKGGKHFKNAALDVCSNLGAKREMGGHRFQMGGAGHHWSPRWRRPWAHHAIYSTKCKQCNRLRLASLKYPFPLILAGTVIALWR